ncbi:MAG: sodium/proline symporter [bacterium]
MGDGSCLTLGGWAVGSFVVYLCVIIGVGLAARRFSSRGIGEFFLGGRRLGTFVVATSAVVSGRSAWLLLGVTGMAYARGASAVWTVVGYIVAELFSFAYLGRRLRRETERSGDLTVPDFFASRFGGAVFLRVVTATIILVFMVAYVAAQIRAGGKALSASFLHPAGYELTLGGLGLSLDAVTVGALITAVIILAYTVTGGYAAVAINDAIQAVVMLTALVVVPVVAALRHPTGVIETLAVLSPTLLDPFALGAGALIGFLGIGLGSPGNPHILVRYMSIRDPRALARAAFWGTLWNVVMAWGALWIGLVGRAHVPGSLDLPKADPEAIYPVVASMHLPAWAFGLVVASIFAAILSTADSQLLVAASCVVRDLGQQTLARGRALSQRRLVAWSRAAVLVLLAAAVVLGIAVPGLIFTLVLFAWAGLGASFGPPLLCALYWRRTSRWGVLAGLLSGTLVTVVWKITPALKGMVYELVPAFAVSMALTVAVSLLTPLTDRERPLTSSPPE